MLLSVQTCTQAFQTSPGTAIFALHMLKTQVLKCSPAHDSHLATATLLLCLKATLRGCNTHYIVPYGTGHLEDIC